VFSQAVTTLSVRDLDASLAFYCGTLGFQLVHRIADEIVHLAGPGMTLALRPFDAPVPPSESTVHIGLTVSDLAAVRRELERRGVVFIGDPVDVNVVRLTFFNDPDGNPLYLCQWLYWRETKKRRYDLCAF
jgi:catechol 2,3-dioxygenase-like lactoylglutathione lyase family enzyme